MVTKGEKTINLDSDPEQIITFPNGTQNHTQWILTDFSIWIRTLPNSYGLNTRLKNRWSFFFFSFILSFFVPFSFLFTTPMFIEFSVVYSLFSAAQLIRKFNQLLLLSLFMAWVNWSVCIVWCFVCNMNEHKTYRIVLWTLNTQNTL